MGDNSLNLQCENQLNIFVDFYFISIWLQLSNNERNGSLLGIPWSVLLLLLFFFSIFFICWKSLFSGKCLCSKTVFPQSNEHYPTLHIRLVVTFTKTKEFVIETIRISLSEIQYNNRQQIYNILCVWRKHKTQVWNSSNLLILVSIVFFLLCIILHCYNWLTDLNRTRMLYLLEKGMI